MAHVAQKLELDVERGPDWLFVRPHAAALEADECVNLAEQVWQLLEQNFSHRLVLELDQAELLRSPLIGQLVWLSKRLHARGGLMRLSGLSPANCQVLEQCGLASRLPAFACREHAVMGYRPPQPR